MEELIELLEKAMGPDQGLNLMIAESVYGRQSQGGTGSIVGALDYTGSIDHALTLVPLTHTTDIHCDDAETFPVTFALRGTKYNGFEARVFYIPDWNVEPPDLAEEYGATPAIAICIAALKARAWLVSSDNAALTTNSEGKP